MCPSCHSWRDPVKRSVSAMLILILFSALAAFALVSSVASLHNDGYRPLPFDRARRS